jgi:enterochelin esterase-like enzyme
LTQWTTLRAGLVLALVHAAACASGGGSNVQKPDAGAAGSGSGAAGTTGAAGVMGAAGVSGTAGNGTMTGAAGNGTTTGAAGNGTMTGAAGNGTMTGAGGTAGAAGSNGAAGASGGAGNGTMTGAGGIGSEGDGDTTIDGPYGLPPEAKLAAGVKAGKLVTLTVTSNVLPQKTRTVQVYVPATYAAGTAAPFMVFQDGGAYLVNFAVANVLDNLHAQGKLPLIISIFVNAADGSLRSAEYDALTDDYSQFVLTELLPAVEAKAAVKLTTDPNGRGIGGHSSGGIAAFTVGWRHPDQFRLILTNSGSFVNIMGGDTYPATIRATTPIKPLRVSLSTGTMDLSSPKWQNANVAMAAALKEMGYHYRFVLENGGTHDQMYPATLITETLLWLWRGYPLN